MIALLLAMATITLPHRFEPRLYQVPLMEAMDDGCLRASQAWHRRSGKDKTDLNIVTTKMMERVGAYYYVFPELAQGRKVLWDGADKDGLRFLDHFPRQLLAGKPNDTEMKLRYRNGSLFQIVGSDRFDAVMGTNPIGMVLGEYSLQDPACWGYFRPILAENGGWAIFNFTPRGENHAYQIHELAKANPFHPVKNPLGWFSSVQTVDDTRAVRQEVLEQERREIIRLNGNDALFMQEYHCSFTVPISGAYYADQISAAYRDGRVGAVPHEPRLAVDTWWDLGVNDRMSIWFTQSVGAELRVIDYMDGTGQGLPFYIGKLQEKGFVYGRHTAPHDIEVRELTTGKTRRDTARALGIDFEVAPRLPLMDGIDATRAIFARARFDAVKTRDGLNALKNYRKQYDDKRKTYLNTPYHDWASNGADAFRTMAVAMDVDHESPPARQGAAGADKYERAVERRRRGGSNPLGALG